MMETTLQNQQLQELILILANDLGNLLNRTLGMYKKYFGGVVVNGATRDKYDDEIETYGQRQ